jgi:hypothetical protein
MRLQHRLTDRTTIDTKACRAFSDDIAQVRIAPVATVAGPDVLDIARASIGDREPEFVCWAGRRKARFLSTDWAG